MPKARPRTKFVGIPNSSRGLPGAGATPDEAGWIAATAGSVASGALIELSLRVEAGRIRAARFRAYGCPHVIGSASWLTERLVGSTRAELEAWDWREAQAALDVPPAKFGRLLTLQDAARAAARAAENRASVVGHGRRLG